jgi:hypothetical protein
MRHLFVSIVSLLVAIAPAAAQPGSETTRLTIRQAPAPVPALKYQLLPPTDEMSPGNAVQAYYRAFSPDWFANEPNAEQINKALATPLSDLPRKELKAISNSAQLREVDLAARREYCDWEMIERIKKEGIGLLLPDVQGLRQLATMLACRARLEIADGQFDKATYTLRTGMAMGKHVGDALTFINALVGVAICQAMLKQVEELIQAPNSPNLYWALAELPRPYIDLRASAQAEKIVLLATIPALKDLAGGPLRPDQQKTLRNQVNYVAGIWEDGPNATDWRIQPGYPALVLMKLYPEARRALIAQGRTPDEVEAMPVVQVVLLRSLQQYERLRDDLFKWIPLPYWQASPGIERLNKELLQARDNFEGVPFISLLPAIGKVCRTTARLDQRIAALRCVEAIRLYAAGHDGKLPASLSDIKEVPVPDDPMTGKPFDYKMDGNKAILSAAVSPTSAQSPENALRYELTLER